VKTHEIELSGGARVTVEEEGAGPAMLLMHAGVSERHMWDPQWQWLSADHRVVRWDWRGFGDTPHVPGPFSYADDVVRIMDALALTRATLIACSFAGGVALQAALERPGRVERLVLLGSGAPGFEGTNPPAVEKLFTDTEEAFGRGDVETALALLERTWLVGPGRTADEVDPTYLETARTLLHRADRPDDGAIFADGDFSAVGRLGEIRVPTLVVVGDEDVPDTIQQCELLAREVPGARLARMAHTAHLPNLERPKEFDAILRPWLEATRPA
jgi:3-oxoadipate enol-lactonase